MHKELWGDNTHGVIEFLRHELERDWRLISRFHKHGEIWSKSILRDINEGLNYFIEVSTIPEGELRS